MMTSLIICGGGLLVVFIIAWLVARRLNFYSLVDAVWAFSIGLAAVLLLSLIHGGGDEKRIVAGLLIAIWSLRLGSHLQRRLRKSFPAEDPRYEKLKDHFKAHEISAWLGFFLIQALSAGLLALPFFLIAADPDGRWSVWETTGAILAFIGIAGEALADSQMTRFKKNHPEVKAICRKGLWNYSRHPNYFFESVIWIGIYIFACGSEFGWTMIHAPVLITFLLIKVTGIPPTEAAALARKGDAYRQYQRRTSAFIPWPRKFHRDSSAPPRSIS
jgi:steroid 5-alpha reductase family enzyme